MHIMWSILYHHSHPVILFTQNISYDQLIVALDDNPRLAGGSPWEVPWGEVVGEESFHTLDHIYTGYGEKGPSQGRLRNEGSSENIKKDFPNLDYILGCQFIDSEWYYYYTATVVSMTILKPAWRGGIDQG